MWHLLPATAEIGDSAALPLAGHAPTYTVGRRDCDIILKDKAVSKRHAELEIRGDELYVRDVGSKFGTAVNGQRLEPNLSRELLDGDEVALGSSVLSVRKRPLVLCHSGMTVPAASKALEAQATAIGATISREFKPNTSHLVMPTVKLTPKLLVALAHACPVVSPGWVEKFVRRSSATEPLPSLTDAECDPPIDTSARTQLPADVHRVRPERARLFANKRFVWLPGSQSASMAETTRLLRMMEAEAVLPWPREATGIEMEFVTQKARCVLAGGEGGGIGGTCVDRTAGGVRE